MKFSLLTYLCSLALAFTAFAQTPTASPSATATATASPAATVSATPSDDEDDIARTVKKKLGHHHLGVTVNGSKDIDWNSPEDAGGIAIAIVAVIFTTVFGAPVVVIGLVIFFSWLKSRSLHRTVREMVAKGHPVPPELFAVPGTPAKARSDLRRGVVFICIGIGVMVFFAAVSDSGAWALGMIPLMIGAGYLLVWKLEGPKKDHNQPPVP